MTGRPIRVLHMLNSLAGNGNGIVNAAVDIMSGQKELGLCVAVCSEGGDLVELLETHGITHFKSNQRRRPDQIPGAILRAKRIIREFKPDIVHCHMITGLLLARLVGLFASFRLVAHLHNVHQRSSDLMRFADQVIAVSDAVARDMTQRGIPGDKLRVVRNGTLGSFRASLHSHDRQVKLEQPAVVTVAGMYHRKGISELLSAFEIVSLTVPHAHLYLVGEGPDRGEFERQAKRSPAATRIHFEGFSSSPGLYLEQARVFVLASRRDSCPLVLPEAREHGCAVVATKVDGIPEMLDDGKAGLLVPPGDPPSLANAIQFLLENPDQLAQMQTAAAANLESFTSLRMAREITALYEELLAPSRPHVRFC